MTGALIRPAVALALGLALTACAPETDVTRTGADRGAEVFATNCAACHGADAKGGGPKAAGLNPAPPDLTRIAARNGGTYPANEVMSTIDGYTSGAKGAAMPAFGEGDLGPLVQVEANGVSTPIPADLLALNTYLESLQQ